MVNIKKIILGNDIIIDQILLTIGFKKYKIIYTKSNISNQCELYEFRKYLLYILYKGE